MAATTPAPARRRSKAKAAAAVTTTPVAHKNDDSGKMGVYYQSPSGVIYVRRCASGSLVYWVLVAILVSALIHDCVLLISHTLWVRVAIYGTVVVALLVFGLVRCKFDWEEISHTPTTTAVSEPQPEPVTAALNDISVSVHEPIRLPV